VPVWAVLPNAHPTQKVLANRDVALHDIVGEWAVLVGTLPVQEQHLADGYPGRVVQEGAILPVTLSEAGVEGAVPQLLLGCGLCLVPSLLQFLPRPAKTMRGKSEPRIMSFAEWGGKAPRGEAKQKRFLSPHCSNVKWPQARRLGKKDKFARAESGDEGQFLQRAAYAEVT
jgi:hypothetical protein